VAKYLEDTAINPGNEIYSGMGKEFFKKTGTEAMINKAIEYGTDYINSFLINSWPNKDVSPAGSEKCIDIGEPALNLSKIMDT